MSKSVLGRLHVLLTAESADFDKKMADVAARMKKTGESIAEVGSSLTQKLTLPLLAVGGTALKMGGDFQASMNQVAAVTGATGDTFDALSDQAKLLGSTTQFSASEAADAMYFLASAGFKTEEIMGAMPGVLQLAAAANMDLATATDIASNILSGYGMEAEELGRVNDVLVKTFQSTNVNVAMLGESMKYAAPVAKAAGIEFEEAASLIGLFGNAGIQGSMAGTALRGTISRLLNPVGEAAEVIAELGLQTKTSSGDLVPMRDLLGQLEDAGITAEQAMRLFGQEAGPAMMAALSEGSQALGDLTEGARNSGGVAEKVASVQMEGFKGAIKGLTSAFEGLQIAIFESGIGEFATMLTAKLTSLLQRATQINPTLMKLGVIFGAIAAAIGPVLFVFGKAAVLFSGFPAYLAPIKAGLAAVTGVLVSLNPVTLGIIAVVAALTAAWLLWSDAIKEIFQFVLPALRTAFEGIWSFIKEFVLLLGALGAAIHEYVFKPLMDSSAFQAFMKIAGVVADFVTTFFVGSFWAAFEAIGWVFEKFAQGFAWVRRKITGEDAPAIQQATSQMFDGVAPAAESAVDAANAALGDIAGGRVNARVTTNIVDNVVNPLATGAAAGEEALKKAAEAAQKAAEALKAYDQALIQGANLNSLTGREMINLQVRAQELAAMLAAGNIPLEQRNQLTQEFNALEAARIKVMGVNTDRLYQLSTGAMDVSQKLSAVGVQLTSMYDRTREIPNALQMFGQHLANTGEAVGAKLGGAAMDIVGKLTPMGFMMEIVGRVLEKLRPAIEALEKPLEIVATVLAAALMPILKALFPVFKLVAIAATYVGEILFRVSQGIAWAVGNVVKAIGAIVSKIPFMGGIGDNLKKFGQGILDVADGYGEAADALKQGRKDISELTWPEEDLTKQTAAIEKSGEDIVAAIYDTAPAEPVTPAGMALEAYQGAQGISIGDINVDARGATDPEQVGVSVRDAMLDVIDQALGYQVRRDTRLDGEMAYI
jgi:TP901 family phage tail tape measure protein